MSELPPEGSNTPPVVPPPVGYASGGTPGVPDAADVEKNKIFAVLAYLGILWLVPLLAAKDSPFARFHANQGIVLFICYFIAGSVCGVLCIVPFMVCVMLPVLLCLVVVHLIFVILGIVNAAGGQMKKLPVIGQWIILK